MGKYLDVAKAYQCTPNQYETAEAVLQAIYQRRLKGACLIPVLPEYQEILGAAVWICSNERQAERKRQSEENLVFLPEEFKSMIDVALQGKKDLESVIQFKRAFNGIIGVVA